MFRFAISICIGLAVPTAITALCAAPVAYDPPPEVASLRPGPGIETAKENCATCHSLDYVNTQPRGAGFGRDFWQSEVTKMVKVFGAPIKDDDAKIIVDYLASTYR